MTSATWIPLDGAANVRDVGGLPTRDGQVTRSHALIRSANLQLLSSRDVDVLVDEYGVRSVADLRSDVEVDAEGPGPLVSRTDVEIAHLSLIPEASRPADAAVDGSVILPWQTDERAERSRNGGAVAVYLGYLSDRADAVVDAVRLIAHSPGATVVHCAAGKDRTGMVVALALAEVGVERDAIVADYARSAEVIEDIFDQLRASPTYAAEMEHADADAQSPRASTITNVLAELDARYGGAGGWLRAHGWTEDDAAALRAKLVG